MINSAIESKRQAFERAWPCPKSCYWDSARQEYVIMLPCTGQAAIEREQFLSAWNLWKARPAHAAPVESPSELSVSPVVLPVRPWGTSGNSHDWDQGRADGWDAFRDELSRLGPLYTRADHGTAQQQEAVDAGLLEFAEQAREPAMSQIKIVQIILECEGELSQASVPPHMDRMVLDALRADDGRIMVTALPPSIIKANFNDLMGIQQAPSDAGVGTVNVSPAAPLLSGEFLSGIHDIAADGDPVSDSLVSNADVLKLVEAVRTLQCRQMLDSEPPRSKQEAPVGHAIPQWLRDQFDAIELEVHKQRAAGVFTQMRTKVQAYFEMQRSVERAKAGRQLYDAAVQGGVLPDGYCIMPRRLTAENGAKALLLGEFQVSIDQECYECRALDEPVEGCEVCDGTGEYTVRQTISWDKIKFIYSEAVKGLALDSTRLNPPSALDDRLRAAGMLSVADLLAGTPLDAFIAHAGVNSIETFKQWVEMRCTEFLRMKARRELEGPQDDDLHEWIEAHAAVFREVFVNLKAAIADSAQGCTQ